jgi:cell division septation protein DedD
MDDDFNPEEFRPAMYRPDTVLTLGPMMLLGLFFVLLLLCSLCFGMGYSMGSRGARNSPPTAQQPVAGTASPATGSLPKRSAVPQKTPDVKSIVNDLPVVSSNAGANSPQPLVTPALPNPASALMIQIAIVSSQEDANVLVGALRKHGYTATARRDPADNKLHVQIGPFSSRNDANAMSQKLLHDGYNAIVQP